jgi:hypothetical protein
MDKKNFFIYTDKSEQINLLSDEQAGILFKALFTYVVNKTELTTTDKLIQLVFIAMRNDIDRDSAKYDSICEKRRLAGIEGNKKRWDKDLSQKSQMRANAPKCSQVIANVADNNNNNDNNNDIINKESKKKVALSFTDKQDEEYNSFLSWYSDNAPYCFKHLKMSEEEYIKLRASYSKKDVTDTIFELENNKQCRKKYASLYRTLLNWIPNHLNHIDNGK